ncbi:hypothetical protein OHB54_25555 [Streptomyces sp. NBC_01007]|nr:hypothetical protein OHB54_25555 [Streptomyces sp. NBC_01007]
MKATADGAYRYDFAGTGLTQATTGWTDFVDVKRARTVDGGRGYELGRDES